MFEQLLNHRLAVPPFVEAQAVFTVQVTAFIGASDFAVAVLADGHERFPQITQVLGFCWDGM